MRGMLAYMSMILMLSAGALRAEDGSYGWVSLGARTAGLATRVGPNASTDPYGPGRYGAAADLSPPARLDWHGNTTTQAEGGMAGAGLYGRLALGRHELSLGGGLTPDGSGSVQLGLGDVLPGPDRSVSYGRQPEPAGVLEYGQQVPLAPRLTLRPFAQARMGDETLARLGTDLVIGDLGYGGLAPRNPVTGFRAGATGTGDPGFALVLGADIAHVSESRYLDVGMGEAALARHRGRLRAGVHYGSGDLNLFYGMTWMEQAVPNRPDSQLLGALQLQLRF